MIKNRRGIRRFADKEVSAEKIHQLIEAARLSPSAKNKQSWRFGILRGEKKYQVAELMPDWCRCEGSDRGETISGFQSSVKNTAKVIQEAPVLILVFRERNDDWRIGNLLSIGSAIEHICLAAIDLGLGSLWIIDTVYVQDEIIELTQTSSLELVSTIAIGYAGETLYPRPRLKTEDLILFK